MIHQPEGLLLTSVVFPCLFNNVHVHVTWVSHTWERTLPFSWEKVGSLSFTCLEVFILIKISDSMQNGLTLLQQQGNIWNANERPRQNRLTNLLEKQQNQPRCRGERLWREYSIYLLLLQVHCLNREEMLESIPWFPAFSLGSFHVIYFE